MSIMRSEVLFCKDLRAPIDPSCCSYPRTEVNDFAGRLICYSKRVRAASDARRLYGMTIQSLLNHRHNASVLISEGRILSVFHTFNLILHLSYVRTPAGFCLLVFACFAERNFLLRRFQFFTPSLRSFCDLLPKWHSFAIHNTSNVLKTLFVLLSFDRISKLLFGPPFAQGAGNI